ncbi:hypothetical protein POTOM_017630 [Populus tomentosa]|uniref:Uncharacterized protein n=1 Tax=Populus tomentosa TaxID=118781 RepID=A0A8X7ZXU8_POPTO|nr:hypothetical protein POTOM_017630 [Populus tomentosa]
METSLRYRVDSKALKIHAKERFAIDSITHLQVHGELDTRIRAPSYVSAMIRHFYPYLSASLRVGLQYDKHEKRNSKTVVEVSWSIYNFHREEVVRFRIRYEVITKAHFP